MHFSFLFLLQIKQKKDKMLTFFSFLSFFPISKHIKKNIFFSLSFLIPLPFLFSFHFPFSVYNQTYSVKVQSQRRVKRGARSSSCIFHLDILKEDKICWSYLIIFSYTDFCIRNYIISKNIMGKQLIEHIITTKIAKRFLR